MSDFGRVYKITATRAPEVVDVDIKGLNANWFEEFEQIVEITNIGQTHYHDIEFEVERTLKQQPSQATIKIYNLSVATRDLLVGGPMKVRLEAGYEDTTRLLFLGDARYVSNELKGTEWITKLQLADGGRAYANARVNQSFAKGTPVRTVLAALSKAFGVPLPFQSQATADLETRIASGETLSGYVADEMTRVLAPFGFDWSFQNGKIQILRADQLAPGELRVIREDTGEGGGMLGAPEVDPPKIRAPVKAGRGGKGRTVKVPKLKVKHTLYPEVSPGERIQVQSRSINGTFRVDVVKHQGDTRGDNWTTEIEATSVKDAVPL